MLRAPQACAAAVLALHASSASAQSTTPTETADAGFSDSETSAPGDAGPAAPAGDAGSTAVPASAMPDTPLVAAPPVSTAMPPPPASASPSRNTTPASPPDAERTNEATETKTKDEEEEGPAIGFDWNGFWLTPLIAPGYSPELQFLIGGGFMASWKADEKSPRSSIPIVAAWGSVGAIVINSLLRSYWLEDRLRIDVDFWAKNLVDHYFGVGYDAGLNTPQGDNTTRYRRHHFQIEPTLLTRVGADLFTGFVVDWNHTWATDMNPQMQMDPHVLATSSDNNNLGMGPVIRWDSRDYPQNAFKGVYAQVSFVPYFLDRDFQILELDYRHYIPVVRPGSTIATQLYTRYSWGDVPWSSMSFVGSPWDLRGYRWMRYRDNTVAWALAEYRYTFKKLKRNRGGDTGEDVLSRHGLVGWAGVGTLGPNYQELGGVLPNGGIGYRFALQKRLNARLDYGFGRESRGFYFSFTEAY